MLKFKNGSYIKSIDAPDSKKGKMRELDMSDIDWFCNIIGLQLFPFQKVFLWLQCHQEMRRIRCVVEELIRTKD